MPQFYEDLENCAKFDKLLFFIVRLLLLLLLFFFEKRKTASAN